MQLPLFAPPPLTWPSTAVQRAVIIADCGVYVPMSGPTGKPLAVESLRKRTEAIVLERYHAGAYADWEALRSDAERIFAELARGRAA